MLHIRVSVDMCLQNVPNTPCVFLGCLDPEKFKEFKLVKRTQLSHNVAKFKFALPTPTSVLGLPIGQHISCRFDWLVFCSIIQFHAFPFLLTGHP